MKKSTMTILLVIAVVALIFYVKRKDTIYKIMPHAKITGG